MSSHYVNGRVYRFKVYPYGLSQKQITRRHHWEYSWWGRILHDVDYYFARSGM